MTLGELKRRHCTIRKGPGNGTFRLLAAAATLLNSASSATQIYEYHPVTGVPHGCLQLIRPEHNDTSSYLLHSLVGLSRIPHANRARNILNVNSGSGPLSCCVQIQPYISAAGKHLN